MEYLCFLVKRICFASLSRVCILSISFQYIRNTSVLYTGAFDFDRGLPRFNYSNWSSFVLVIAIRSENIRIRLFAYVICDDYRARARRLYKRARQGLWSHRHNIGKIIGSGWSLSYDSRHGRCSFVNLLTKL